MSLLPPNLPEASPVWTLAAGAAAGLIYLRRFLSRQSVDLKKDSAEAHLIKTLQEERDRAMAAAEKAWETRAEDAKLIGELSSEVKASRAIIDELKTQLRDMKLNLDSVLKELQEMKESNRASTSGT